MNDILARIDAAVDGLCACGCATQLRPDGPSQWYATEECQTVHMDRLVTRPYDVYSRPEADVENYTWTDRSEQAPANPLRHNIRRVEVGGVDNTHMVSGVNFVNPMPRSALDHWRSIFTDVPNASITATAAQPHDGPSIWEQIRELCAAIPERQILVVDPATRDMLEQRYGDMSFAFDIRTSPHVPEGTIYAIDPAILNPPPPPTFTFTNTDAMFRPAMPPARFYPRAEARGLETQAVIYDEIHQAKAIKRARMRHLHTSYQHRRRARR